MKKIYFLSAALLGSVNEILSDPNQRSYEM